MGDVLGLQRVDADHARARLQRQREGSAAGRPVHEPRTSRAARRRFPTPTGDGDLPVSDIVRDDARGKLYVSTDFGVLRGRRRRQGQLARHEGHAALRGHAPRDRAVRPRRRPASGTSRLPDACSTRRRTRRGSGRSTCPGTSSGSASTDAEGRPTGRPSGCRRLSVSRCRRTPTRNTMSNTGAKPVSPQSEIACTGCSDGHSPMASASPPEVDLQTRRPQKAALPCRPDPSCATECATVIRGFERIPACSAVTSRET